MKQENVIFSIITMISYFNKWGWFFDSERRKVNKEITKQY